MMALPRAGSTPNDTRRPDDAWTARAHHTALATFGAATLILAAAALLIWSWHDELPDGMSLRQEGPVDQIQSIGEFVTTMLGIGLGSAVVFTLLLWLRGRAPIARRLLGSLTVWTGTFHAVTTVALLNTLRGWPEAIEVGTPLAAGFVVAFAVAAGTWFLIPQGPTPAATVPTTVGAPRALRAGKPAVWQRTVQSPQMLAAAAVVVLVMTVPAVVGRVWWTLTVPAVLAALILALFRFVVRVDATGITVRSAIGVPRTRIPAREVEVARAVEVDPLGQFGGWGWRVGIARATVIVPRRGEGIEVARSGGRVLVVTVDDAADGVKLLNTMADRARNPTDPGSTGSARV